MRKFPFAGEKPCPLCGFTDVKEAILVPVTGTQEGLRADGLMVHTDCILRNTIYLELLKVVTIRHDIQIQA